jgi:hypothetical protein
MLARIAPNSKKVRVSLCLSVANPPLPFLHKPHRTHRHHKYRPMPRIPR